MEAFSTLGLLWIIAAWFMVAFFAANVASTQRRSPMAWFLGGLLVGPVALLALAGMRDLGLECESCREPIDKRASVCPHCQSAKPFGASKTNAPHRR